MGNIAQRLHIDFGRGWVILVLIVAALIGVAFWVGPLKPLPPRLQLLAVDGLVAVEEISPTSQRFEDGIRFAVPVAVRNIGARPVRARRLALSVPGHYQLTTARGALPGEVSPGVPLRRYVLDLPSPLIRPGTATQRLAGLDTLYIVPDLPSYYCSLYGLDVPEFVPAPSYRAETLADVRVFYSFGTGDAGERHTGLLTVKLDPALLRTRPAPMPPSFRTAFAESQAETPELGALRFVGTRTAYCGDPEQPLELFSALWETMSGGRFFVIYVQGAPRKHLFDLNRDGTIELETWDADGDGNFEARREARYAAPQFLFPRPTRLALLSAPDSTPPDSAWLALFHNATAGPSRFARPPAPPPQFGMDSALLRRLATDTAGLRRGDSAFVRLFHDIAAGPFRFTRPVGSAPAQQPVTTPGPIRTQPDVAPGVTPAPATGQPAQPPRAAPAQPPGAAPVQPAPAEPPPVAPPAADTTPRAPERPRRRSGPLGVPVDTMRG